MFIYSDLGEELGLVLRLGLGTGLGLGFVVAFNCNEITKMQYDWCHNRSRRIKISFRVRFRNSVRVRVMVRFSV